MDPAPPVVTSPPGALQLPPAGSLYHGVFPAGSSEPDSDTSPANLDEYERAVGRHVAWVYFSNEWFVTRQFPLHTAQLIRARGSVPFIRLMVRSQRQQTVTDPRYTLDRIIAGEFDDDLGAWADGAKAFATPLIVEYGTEINGDWFPWSAPYNGGIASGPARFRAAYRHIVQLMRARGATNVTWALHYMGENWPGDEPENIPSAYYPGDDVVDWIGLSIYATERPGNPQCPTFQSLMDGILPQIARATTQKPLFIFEFGVTGQNTRCDPGTWTTGALTNLLGGRWPRVMGFSWWNERFSIQDMRVQVSPAIQAAFRAALGGPHAGEVVERPILR